MSANVYACAVFILYSYVCICTHKCTYSCNSKNVRLLQLHKNISQLILRRSVVLFAQMIVAFSQRSHYQIGRTEIFEYCMNTNLDLKWSSLKKNTQGSNILRCPLFKDFLKLLILTNHYFHVRVIARSNFDAVNKIRT